MDVPEGVSTPARPQTCQWHVARAPGPLLLEPHLVDAPGRRGPPRPLQHKLSGKPAPVAPSRAVPLFASRMGRNWSWEHGPAPPRPAAGQRLAIRVGETPALPASHSPPPTKGRAPQGSFTDARGPPRPPPAPPPGSAAGPAASRPPGRAGGESGWTEPGSSGHIGAGACCAR